MANVPAIENVAAKVAAEKARGHDIIVVVSAMAGVTNQLVSYCTAIDPLYDPVEYDAIVASGEQVTSGLLALALKKRGIAARSFQGWQVPVKTSSAHAKARISDIPSAELSAAISQGVVAVVAGFQGVTAEGRISTLGRGGSDTSAVAIAAAVKAERCDIYTDVDGVYTADPRIVARAAKINRISYDEMMEMASVGAKVLQVRSVELAMQYNVPVQVLSSFAPELGSDIPGTMVLKKSEVTGDKKVEHDHISGVTHSRDEAKVTLRRLPDIPGIASQIFGLLAGASVNVDMIVQNVSAGDTRTDLTFTIARADLPRTLKVLGDALGTMDGATVESSADVAKVSIVGIGVHSAAGIAARMFKALAEKNINIQAISTSEIKISVLIAEEHTENAVRALHTAYGLDKPEAAA